MNHFSPQTGSVCSLALLTAMLSSSQCSPAKKQPPSTKRELPHSDVSVINSGNSPLLPSLSQLLFFRFSSLILHIHSYNVSIGSSSPLLGECMSTPGPGARSALLECSRHRAVEPRSEGPSPSGVFLLVDQTVPSCHSIHWS